MRISILTFTAALALVCCSSKQSEVHKTLDASLPCTKRVDLGSKDICLPVITGMRDVSSNEQVMDRPGARVSDKATVQALYITEKQAAFLNNLDEVALDDYFKVYTINSIASKDFPLDALDDFAEKAGGGAVRRNWSDLSSDLEKLIEGVEFGQPVLMETYNPSDHIASMVYLASVHGADSENYSLMTMSLCVVNNRLVWVTHYLAYDGPRSVKQAKAKSDYFTLRLVEANA